MGLSVRDCVSLESSGVLTLYSHLQYIYVFQFPKVVFFAAFAVGYSKCIFYTRLESLGCVYVILFFYLLKSSVRAGFLSYC